MTGTSLSLSGFRIDGVALDDQSGRSVASAGDVNGDGYDDLIIGAPEANPNGTFSGASYVVFGKVDGFAAVQDLSALDGSNGFKLNSLASSNEIGYSVASAGDVNGDGYDDVIVGAPKSNLSGYNSGSSYIVFGKSGGFAAVQDMSALDGSNGFRLDGAAANASSGCSVASAGDVNGDGYDDLIIVGDRGLYANGLFIASSCVIFGKSDGFAAVQDLSALDGSNGFRLYGTVDNRSLSVASAGDVNGDGYDDIIVGSPSAAPNGYNSGSSYIVFGKSGGFAAVQDLSALDGSNGFRLDGTAGDSYSGLSVASAGDVNGDGYDDLIIGAPYAQPNGPETGSSYIVFGKAGGFAAVQDLSALDGSNGFRLDGLAGGNLSGFSVASAGDVNGDGYDDLIIGAPMIGGIRSDAGSSYIVFGKAGGFAAVQDLSALDGSNGFRLDGVAGNTYSGFSVASAGDVNGDGYDDVIIGDSLANWNGTRSGSSYVIFGGIANLSALDAADGVVDGVISLANVGNATTLPEVTPPIPTGKLYVGSFQPWADASNGAGTAYTCTGTFMLGNSTGTEAMLRIEGAAVTVQGHFVRVLHGTVYSALGSISDPLFSGDFVIDTTTMKTTSLAENAASPDFFMANVAEVGFDGFTIRDRSIVFDTGFDLDLVGATYSTPASVIDLKLNSAGLSVVPGTVSTGMFSGLSFDLPKLPASGQQLEIGFKDVTAAYDFANDTFYLAGVATCKVELWGQTATLTLDMDPGTGAIPDHFLSFRGLPGSADFDWEIVGKLTGSLTNRDDGAGTLSLMSSISGFRDLSVSIDTIHNTFTAGAQFQLPIFSNLVLGAEISFLWDPFQIDSVQVNAGSTTIKGGGLDVPIFSTGLFAQAVTLGVSGIASSLLADPLGKDVWTFTGRLDFSVGPELTEIAKGAATGSFTRDGFHATLDLTSDGRTILPEAVVTLLEAGSSSNNKIVNAMQNWFGVTAKDVLDFKFFELKGDFDYAAATRQYTMSGTMDLLDGLVTADVKVSANANFDITLKGHADLTMPKDLPFVGGHHFAGASVLLNVKNDGTFADDFVAIWEDITIDYGFGSFTKSLGFKLAFDGTYTNLGSRDIQALSGAAAASTLAEVPASALAASALTLQGTAQFTLSGTMSYALLSAHWANAATGARLVLIAPDGTVYGETKLGTTNGFDLVDDLTSATGRTLAIDHPVDGIWTIGVKSDVALTGVGFDAREGLDETTISDVTVGPDGTVLGHIGGPLNKAAVTLYVDTDGAGFDGTALAVPVAVAADGSFTASMDPRIFAPGTYSIYAMATGRNAVPVEAYASGTVTVAGASDLVVSVKQGFTNVAGQSVLNVVVENKGTVASGAFDLSAALPEGYVLSTDSASDWTTASGVSTIHLGDLAAGGAQSFVLILTAGTGATGTIVEISSLGALFDSDPFSNKLQFSVGTPTDGVLPGPTAATAFADFIQIADSAGQLIDGLGGNDTLLGGVGSDTLVGGKGADLLNGGDGIDIASYANATAAVVVNLSRIASNTGSAQGDHYLHIEGIEGSSFADKLVGDGNANTLAGLAGADRLFGGRGDDTLIGGAGNDRLNGGSGKDTAVFDGTGNAIIDLRLITAQNTGAGMDTLRSIESVQTGAGNDSLQGSASTVELAGGAGDDHYTVRNSTTLVTESADGGVDQILTAVDYALAAGSHIEFLAALQPADTAALSLTGNAFDQIITGNAGANRLDGGGGQDTLVGGAGDDTFAFHAALVPSNIVQISDFDATSDRLELSSSIFVGLAAGVLNASEFRQNLPGRALDADDHVLYETDTGFLFYDADGAGGAAKVHFATIAPNLHLSGADFLIV